MVVHEKAVGATVEWYTPPSLFEALGLTFDLDPASGCCDQVPALRQYKIWRGEDGLVEPWAGRVWLNPPYGPQVVPFIDKMVEHKNGILLVAARTETRWFQKAARSAEAVHFLSDRLHFIRQDGLQARSSHASVLMAWGEECVTAVLTSNLGGWRFVQPGDYPCACCGSQPAVVEGECRNCWQTSGEIVKATREEALPTADDVRGILKGYS